MQQDIKKKVSKEKKKKGSGSGRPPKKSHQEQVEISKEDENLWFFHSDLVEIVQYLGKCGQILLKSLSGQVPSDVKTKLENVGVGCSEIFKRKRQEFSDALNKYQKFILRHLGYEEDKKYMFMGENSDKVSFNNPPNEKFQLLIPILDPLFVKTFEYILNGWELIPDDHKMLYDWATIKVLTQDGRNLLNDLQTLENKDTVYNYQQRITQQKEYMQEIQSQNEIPNVEGLVQQHIWEFIQNLQILIRQVK